MLVPEIVFVLLFDVGHAAVIPTPGAVTSTPAPKLENDANRSLPSHAATVIASGTRAGEVLLQFVCALPAATQNTTPSAIARLTAASSAVEAPPPSDRFATAGCVVWSDVTQSTPAITPDMAPEPLASSTRTAIRCVALATPCSVPPIVEATCVPWPLASSA